MITVAQREMMDAAQDQESPVKMPAQRAIRAGAEVETSTISIGTFVLWVVVLVIGVVGMTLSYTRPIPPAPEPAPVQAEILNVELTTEPQPPEQMTQAPAEMLSQPPTLPQAFTPPDAPALVAVAEWTPAVAFALPVEGPSRVVEVARANYAAPATQPAARDVAPSVPQRLTFGYGEGKQPAPDYPRQSIREGQEGIVTVRFKVGENGGVISAEAAVPCPWSLLNDAAVRVVRERWRFRSGPQRLHEVAIHFKLQK